MNINTSWTTNRISTDTIQYAQNNTTLGDVLIEVKKIDGQFVVTKGRNDITDDLLAHATSVLA